MKRFSIILMLVALVLASVPAGAVAAQAQSNETTQAQGNETATDSGGKVIDEDLRLVNWSYDYDAEKFSLRFESDRPKRVTLTEAVQMSEGSGDGTIRRTTISEGVTTVELSISPVAGQAAVFITTSKTQAENRFAWVSTGQTDTSGGGPFAGTSSTAGWLGGATTAVAMVGAAAYRRKNKDYDDVEDFQ